MNNLLYIAVALALLSCGGSKNFNGFPFVGEVYPIKATFPQENPRIAAHFMAPSTGGHFFEVFQDIKIEYITSTRQVFRITGERTYTDHNSCDSKRKELWDLAKDWFGGPKDDGQGNWDFAVNNQFLNIYCAVPAGSAHAYLSVSVTDKQLMKKQIQMYVDAAKH